MTDDQVNEIKRHFDVVAEDLRHELRLIIERQAVTEKKLDEHLAEAHRNNRELRMLIQTVHDSLAAKLDALGNGLRREIRGGREGLHLRGAI